MVQDNGIEPFLLDPQSSVLTSITNPAYSIANILATSKLKVKVVHQGGIEPPTPASSMLCSTN